MGELIDSEKHINYHVRENKRIFRQEKPFYCSKCRTENTMLESCSCKESDVSFTLNCYDCGGLETVNSNEAELYRQMILYKFAKSEKVIAFKLFQVCHAYSFFQSNADKGSAAEIIERLEKKLKKWNWIYKIKYWSF